MRMSPAAAVVPALLVLLTWLSFRAIDLDAERYDRALKALDRFTMIEIALHRDVLSARAGILRNYDPLVRAVGALREALDRLHDNSSADAEEAAAIDRFAAATKRQEELTEQFKTDNALLQNSLADFLLFSARLSASAENATLAAGVSALAASMLQLTLDTSAAAANEVTARLSGLATQPVTAGESDTVQALLAHGRLLRDLLPTTDSVLKALLAAPGKAELTTLRTMILKRQAQSRATARVFRLLLYATSLFLVGVLTHFGLRLRARTLTLRRRASFEHLIAGISTRLIETQRQEIGAHIDRALAELAEYLGADRAYLVISASPTRMHRWCRAGTTFPPGWPDAVPELATRFKATPGGIIHIRAVGRLACGADKAVLAAAGLQGWACVSKPDEAPAMVLGFDALRPGIITQPGEFGLLRTALDAIANAVHREHLEQERARLETNLQHARRMETVGALASGIAHNFNNIVGAILGHTEMAEAQLAPDSRPAHDIKEIRRAGERARDLVEQILVFGGRRDSQRRPVSIKNLVAETSSLLRASLASGIELVIHGVPEAAVVSGQPGQLQQVLLNLCNNAAQAIDQAGRVEVQTEVHEVTGARSLTQGELRPGRYVRIAISDVGRGIDETTLRHIFEPFFTTRPAGNGLGLATVRETVREHGGAIHVWSASGVGSRFEVWLPCTAEPLSAPDDSLRNFSLGRGETVLVVEDAGERLLADEEMLAALGYEPVGFICAGDALAACRATPNRFDALLVGHLTPANSALDLAAKLRQSVPDVPILLATASAGEVHADALAAAGISEIVRLPLVSAEIASVLARWLQFRKLRSPSYDRNAFAQY
ncbi:MAG: two-component system VirA-like sensor kinase [Alphaproteobacteria bacterium]|nr:two-component system VirA-like sensor kinase [Alphaproteobacteria bacterium]